MATSVSGSSSPSLGRCIYCGSTQTLTREHIIPRAFGGTWVMQGASCVPCADITKRFEMLVARRMLGPHRLRFGYKSSKKSEIPKTLKVNKFSSTGGSQADVPLDEMPIFPIIVPVFDLPSIITGFIGSSRIGTWTWNPDNNSPLQKKRLDAIFDAKTHSVGFNIHVETPSFMRMLAKIAHSGAMAIHGNMIREPLLPDFILGHKNDLCFVVGSILGGTYSGTDPHSGMHFRLGIYVIGNRRYLVAQIEMFAYIQPADFKGDKLPPFIVVICEADDVLEQAELGPAGRVGR